MIHPEDYPRHVSGDGKRFQVRTLNGEWQVYSACLLHICTCTKREVAEMVADTLERVADENEKHVPPSGGA